MKYTKKILLLLALLSLIYTIFLINDTYAKYKSDANANTDITIARWNILVNNQDIKNNKDFSSTITPVFAGNENMASGIIAPTAEGYFDITVDYSNVDVSFSLNLNIVPNSTVTDLIITGYSINDGSIIPVENNSYNITSDILYTETPKTKKYRFYIKWDDSENAQMDNQADTAATNDGNASFKITASFIQLASS